MGEVRTRGPTDFNTQCSMISHLSQGHLHSVYIHTQHTTDLFARPFAHNYTVPADSTADHIPAEKSNTPLMGMSS